MIEVYTINQEDTDITQSDTTAESLQDLFVYRVPKGSTIILRPGDELCFDCDETDASVCQNTAQVKVERRDAANVEKTPLLGPLQYANFSASGVGEFRDRDKIVTLEISQEIRVEEQEYIAIMVKNPTPYADKDTSFFELRTHRER